MAITLQADKPFVADRLVAAADSLSHIAGHQRHLRDEDRPKQPSPPDDIAGHLWRVYFRTRQAQHFLQQANDPEARALPKWARDFYQLATRAYERHDRVAADEMFSRVSRPDGVRSVEDAAGWTVSGTLGRADVGVGRRPGGPPHKQRFFISIGGLQAHEDSLTAGPYRLIPGVVSRTVILKFPSPPPVLPHLQI
jgi:hypothetical protein